MNEAEVFLNAIKAANGNNEILETLKISGVAFIDYKALNDKIVDGVRINSCIRLKTLPKKSGFVGSRKIYYNKIDIASLYPFLNDALVVVSEHADIEELLDELLNQCGIHIEKSFIKTDIKTKLVFDNDKCGNVTLETNDQSLFISGHITVYYTCNKYRVLNYVKNRAILLSENEFISSDGATDLSCIPWFCYYYDLAYFPPDHDLYVEYNMTSADNGNVNTSNAFDTLTDYMRRKGSFYQAKYEWDRQPSNVLKRVILGYLKYVSLFPWYLSNDDQTSDQIYRDSVYVSPISKVNTTYYKNRNILEKPPMSMDDYEAYFYGKTSDLVTKIKSDYQYVVGSAGVNLNFENVFAIRFTNPNKKGDYGVGTILTFYWD